MWWVCRAASCDGAFCIAVEKNSNYGTCRLCLCIMTMDLAFSFDLDRLVF